MFQPMLGLLAYVGYGLLSPQSFTWGLASTFPHSKLIAGATVLGCFISPPTRKFVWQREFFLVIAIWLLFGVSTMFAFSPEAALNDFINASKMFLMFFLVTWLINSADKLHLLLKVVSMALGLLAIKIGLFVLMTGAQSPINGPENSYLAANNSIGMALAMNVPLLFYLSRVEHRRWLRWLLRGMLLLSYPAVVGTFSRGDWLGLAVITFLITLKLKNKLFIVSSAVIIVLMAALWIPYNVSIPLPIRERFETFVNYEEDASAESRFWNWEFCKRIGEAHPIAGAGFKFYSPHLYMTYYPEFVARWGVGKYWACHNMYLTLFAEHGALTFFLWMVLLVSTFLSLRRIRNAGKAHQELSWMTDYGDMLSIAVVGFVVMGVFVDFAYYEGYYQLIATVIVAKRLIPLKETLAHSKASRIAAPNPIVVSPALPRA
jgi:probable O-glycosylation ligase (exosortase A-associated)